MKSVWLGLFTVMAAGEGLAATINHFHVAVASNFPLTVMSQIATQKWVFTHASVGGNIVEGLTTLHSENASRYPLSPSGIGTAGTYGGSDYRAANPPASTTAGTVYECARGNPSWDNKVLCFSNTLVRAGWGANKVHFAMDKFCWIDPDADSTQYLQTLSGLGQRFTNLNIVYTTIPLTGSADGENNLRNTFNRAVRAYCLANGKLLYDVADIEAWSPQNVQQTYVSGTQTNQRMYSGYAVDAGSGDWHLNSVGQRRLALGWYAAAATVVNTNILAAFSFRAVALTNSVVLRWPNPTQCGLSNQAVHVRYALDTYPASTNDGTEVYTGTNRVYEHTGLMSGQTYYYTIWGSHDGITFIAPP